VFDDLLAFRGAAWRGAVDIVTAGFPCQPFSVAGNQLGKEDERWLWPSIENLIEDVDPPFVFLENVPGFTLHGLDAVLEGLARLGFDAEWDSWSAAGVGAPHLRRRFYMVARRVSHPDSGRLRISPERGAGAAPEADSWHPLTWDLGSEDVAHGDRDGLEGGGQPEHAGLEGPRWGESDRRSDDRRLEGPEVGDPTSSRRQGRERLEEAEHRYPWPPGPSDSAGWDRYGGAQPVLRRGVDGDADWAYRTDRLYHLGNGVVPIVAARAFTALAKLLLS
jgi:DNA (cytosine-5)-methyltransferase 1